eukprot:2049831-Pyramimonas_sp.AAC.1
MWLSPECRAQSGSNFAKVSRVPVINLPETLFSGFRVMRAQHLCDSRWWSPKHGVLAQFRIVKTQQS